MKTVTEISGFQLKTYFQIKGDLIRSIRPEFEKKHEESKRA